MHDDEKIVADGSRSPAEDRAEADSKLVEEVIEPDDILPEATLEDLPQPLRDACARAGWGRLMPVQARSLPYILAGNDLMVQSRTGSGKTGAFLLPVMERIDTRRNVCQALILVPTRELAKQVAQEAETLAGDTDFKVLAMYGGVSYGAQLTALKEGAHLVVGTPGRVLDHLLRRSFTLEHLEFLIFDEADRMLSIGFYPDMKAVQRYLPKRRVHSLMFSATFPPQVMRLAGEFLREPQMLSLSHKQVHVADVLHVFYEVPAMGKERRLARILEVENPASAIIFCNTKADVHFVTEVLRSFGYDADELSSDLSQGRREQVLGRIRGGNLRFLVATDVAARGIDIPELSHVILYGPPEDPESYIHRAGRTGRAGASGEVIILVDVIQRLELERIGRRFGINLVERQVPSDEDVQAVVAERMTALLESRFRGLKPLDRERITRHALLARTLAQSEEGLALMAMLLDDVYQQALHAKPDLPPVEEERPARPRGDRPGRGERQERPARKEREPRVAKDAHAVAPAATRDAEPAPAQAGEGAGIGAEGEDAAKPKRKRRRRRKKSAGGEGGADSQPSPDVGGAGEGGGPEGAED